MLRLSKPQSIRNTLAIAAALVCAIPLGNARAAELIQVATWCYAATGVLKEEAGSISAYGMLNNHLESVLREKFATSPTRARIEGMGELRRAARSEGMTEEEMALRLYDRVCKPVFVQ